MGDWEQKVTLYHHSDGYPESILPLIKKAFDDVHTAEIYALNENMKQLYKEHPSYNSWQLGRAGKVASFLCAEDPGSFEPEEGHELHGDIEWYYIVECMNEKGGSMSETPTWKITIYNDIISTDDETKLGKPLATINVSEVEEWLKKYEKENQ